MPQAKNAITVFVLRPTGSPSQLTKATLQLFIAHLISSKLSHATMKVYLSTVRHAHITAGLHSSFDEQLTPQLQQVLRGVQKIQAVTMPPRVHLPITLTIMEGIKRLLQQKPQSHDNVVIWAACCLGFFGFLHVSEFTIPVQEQYDHTTHLSFADISINNKHSPQLIKICIKQFKIDPFVRE